MKTVHQCLAIAAAMILYAIAAATGMISDGSVRDRLLRVPRGGARDHQRRQALRRGGAMSGEASDAWFERHRKSADVAVGRSRDGRARAERRGGVLLRPRLGRRGAGVGAGRGVHRDDRPLRRAAAREIGNFSSAMGRYNRRMLAASAVYVVGLFGAIWAHDNLSACRPRPRSWSRWRRRSGC